ncbi:MAG: hypothetical protein M0P69_22240 [Bacteroidales bacterium]|nr:hypothetical protein [Bacteroidales bacterium]
MSGPDIPTTAIVLTGRYYTTDCLRRTLSCSRIKDHLNWLKAFNGRVITSEETSGLKYEWLRSVCDEYGVAFECMTGPGANYDVIRKCDQWIVVVKHFGELCELADPDQNSCVNEILHRPKNGMFLQVEPLSGSNIGIHAVRFETA